MTEWWSGWYKEINDGESVARCTGPADIPASKDKWRFRETITDPYGKDVDVSTVFLGLDHSYDEGIPVLYETMIFGGAHDDEQWRYYTRAEALEGHEKAKALVMGDKKRRKAERRKA